MSETKEVVERAGETVGMKITPSASIIIDNYNYGRYVTNAIESALAQTLPDVEVIVVDDGSTDNSREVIRPYGDRTVTIFKENGGQGSALNVGFARSSGDVVLFLDADDMLVADALEQIMPCFSDPEIVKVHWPLLKVDVHGRSLGELLPPTEIPDGDLRARVCCDGPSTIAWPGQGNAWSRKLLRQILPMPEELYRTGADTYLFELAPFFGPMKTVPEPLTLYRMHHENFSRSMSFERRMARELRFADHYTAVVSKQCEAMGAKVDLARWRANSWWYRLGDAADEIRSCIPDGERFILIDDAAWAMDALDARVALPFPEQDGWYAGPSSDDESAIAEFQRTRQLGIRFVVVAWQSFWWLDHYKAFAEYLYRTSTERLRNEGLLIFEAKDGSDIGGGDRS